LSGYYLSAPVDEIELAASVAPSVAALGGRVPSSNELLELTRSRGLDYSTMYLYEALRAAPSNRAFIDALDTQPERAESAASTPKGKVLVVPALFYGHYPETGADAALAQQIARKTGFEAERIPIRSVGTVAGNADIIRQHLEKETAENLWIFSVSKGSADFRAFLQRCADLPAVRRIRGWISVCGLANGCHITDYNIATPLRALKYRAICRLFGVSFELMRELATSNPLWRSELRLPENMRLFNFAAIPLPSHVQRSVMGRYRAISALGPNDGMVLCRDSILDAGPVYPVWGCDHFFRAPQCSSILYRLFRHVKGL